MFDDIDTEMTFDDDEVLAAVRHAPAQIRNLVYIQLIRNRALSVNGAADRDRADEAAGN